jgi:hypothetical protein
MKRILLIIAFAMLAFTGWSQDNMFTISGGSVFADIDDSGSEGNGFRINGLFEYNPMGGSLAHGFSIGYIDMTSTAKTTNANYDIYSIPIYYAPKLLIGKGSFKIFIKGALGTQFSGYKRTGTTGGEISTTDFGFYGGGSAGAMLLITPKLFINAEYEYAYMSNSYYKDGVISSAMGGIGFKF